jgi:hypothetical protein
MIGPSAALWSSAQNNSSAIASIPKSRSCTNCKAKEPTGFRAETSRLFLTRQRIRCILLIGDSIRMGYCKTVRAQLADVVNVFYPAENCRNTQNVITRLNAWSKEFPADEIKLVQFNCGHWDIAHWNGDEESLTTVDEYRRSFVCSESSFPRQSWYSPQQQR